MTPSQVAAPAHDTPARGKALRKQQLDAIMRDASDVVLSQIRKMKDFHIVGEDGKKMSVDSRASNFRQSSGNLHAFSTVG